MRRTERPPSCDEARERIDDLLDGQEPEAALADHLGRCPACARELALARRLQEAMAEGLPPLACPDEVSDAVLRLAAEEAAEKTARRAGGRRRFLQHRPAGQGTGLFAWVTGPVWRPALAALVLLLLVAAPVAVWQSLDDELPVTADAIEPAEDLDGYTPAEIAAAEQEARQVLAYIASVSRDAGEAVRQEVFEERVVAPVRRLAEETP